MPVLERDSGGSIHWNPRYLDFAHYYGFTPLLCEPYRAQTKGKVESGVKYVRRNFWLGLRFVDLLGILTGKSRLGWKRRPYGRRHGTTGEVPLSLARPGARSNRSSASPTTIPA